MARPRRRKTIDTEELLSYAFAAGGIWLGWKIVQAFFDFQDHPAPGFLDTMNGVMDALDADEEPRLVRASRRRIARPIELRKNTRTGIYEPI